MITAYAVGAIMMAWHLWTRRARVRKRWLNGDATVRIAFWPVAVAISVVEGLLDF